MATYPDQHSESSHNYPSQYDDHGYKSRDDLIDENAAPYSETAHYTTHTVGIPLGNGSPRSAYPTRTAKPSHSSDFTAHSDDLEIGPSQGYPPVAPKEIDTRTFWQKVLPESLACRLYVVTVLVETTIDLAIEGDLLLRFHHQGITTDGAVAATSKMPVYLSVFALAHVFQLAMALDAVYARNTLQFISLTIFNALFLLYAIVQIREVQKLALSETDISSVSIDTLTAALPIVISIAEVAYIGLGWKIYHEFGWKVYKFLGADRRIKKMYAHYQIFQCLVKFDVFFWVGFSVQFIWLVLAKETTATWEYYITCAALPVSLVLLVEGHLAARHENKPMMWTFMAGCIGANIYFMYKLVKLIKGRDGEFQAIFESLSTFSLISIILLIITSVFSVIVLRNFGHGLKDAMDRSQATQQMEKTGGGPHQRAASKQLNRMSIN